MTTPLRIARADPASPAGAGRDSAGSWLNVVTGMLRVPEGEKNAVRDELESHLRERVRDLMLAGLPEHAATTQAISELGDAAALARRYQEAIGLPKRRFIMYAAAIGTIGAALALGGVAVFSQPEAAELKLQNRALTDFLISLTAETPAREGVARSLLTMEREAAEQAPDAPGNARGGLRTREFVPPTDGATDRARGIEFEFNGGNMGDLEKAVKDSGVTFRWDRLESVDFAADVSLPFKLGRTNLAEVIARINESPSRAGQTLGIREHKGGLVIAPDEYFDLQEITLVTCDISPLVRRRVERDPEANAGQVLEDVARLVQGLVHADHWRDNGGERAYLHSYDTKLFIKAPRRFQAEIKWVLDELLAEPDVRRGEAGALIDLVPVLREVPAQPKP